MIPNDCIKVSDKAVWPSRMTKQFDPSFVAPRPPILVTSSYRPPPRTPHHTGFYNPGVDRWGGGSNTMCVSPPVKRKDTCKQLTTHPMVSRKINAFYHMCATRTLPTYFGATALLHNIVVFHPSSSQPAVHGDPGGVPGGGPGLDRPLGVPRVHRRLPADHAPSSSNHNQ